jgi:hypothetical protein
MGMKEGIRIIPFPCKKRPPRRVKATFRRSSRQDVASFCGGVIGSTDPTLCYPHGIGGDPAVRITRIVVVGIAIVVDIAEVGRVGRGYR